ncbi:MAG: hypothetical protein AAGF31_00280 [Planctomycetota bacterium]
MHSVLIRCGSIETVMFVALLTCVGCSNAPVPASGIVQYENGEPISGAIRVIRFEPAKESTAEIRKVASSEINQDGSFDLMTYKPGDGAFRGDYIVTLTVLESPITGKSLIPAKYTHRESTPLKVTVDGAKSDYRFEIAPLKSSR